MVIYENMKLSKLIENVTIVYPTNCRIGITLAIVNPQTLDY